MADRTTKKSYSIACSSSFRDAVDKLARRREVNAADLARSVVLVFPADVLARYPDPGEPERDDRETIILKSGSSKGRPWRRKPRIQVRMVAGLTPVAIRRALGIALAMDRGEIRASLVNKQASGQGQGSDGTETVDKLAVYQGEIKRLKGLLARTIADHTIADHKAAKAKDDARRDGQAAVELRDDIERLRAVISLLSFDILGDGIKTRDEALYILGLPPGRMPMQGKLRSQFRILATIHHPDGEFGDHKRMSQLNAAMALLRSAVG